MSASPNMHTIPGERMPRSGVERVLDLGCGVGQSLPGADLSSSLLVYGVDIDLPALREAVTRHPDAQFVCAAGEQLPFQDGTFDVVISGVALPYMELRKALREIHRVLKPGGRIRVSLHPVSFTLQELEVAIKSGSWKAVVYRIYVLLNGLFFHVAGRQFRFPLQRKRIESFQTIGAMSRVLRTTGFQNYRVDSKQPLRFTGEKQK